MIALWIVLALAAALLAASYIVFSIACVRDKGYPWEDHEAMVKKVGKSYADIIKGGVTWLRRQEPEDLYLTSEDGLKLHARWVPAKNPKGTVILFHGWRSSVVGDFSPSMPEYRKRGFNLLLVDQRAQNGSEGRYITFGIKERRDVKPWVELHNARFGPCPVILGGISMGATTVLMAAGSELPENVRGVVADCGFTSPVEIMKAVGKAKIHFVPRLTLALVNLWCQALAGFDIRAYSTLEAMEQNRLPVFFVHGEADNFVPCEMTLRAYETAKCEKTLLTVPGAGHGRSFLIQRERYLKMLDAFLNQALTKSEKEAPTP